MEAPWSQTPAQVLEHFGVHPERGLSSDQAAQHAQVYGKNGTASLSSLLGLC
jgi:Ca2+ transporting ATPase